MPMDRSRYPADWNNISFEIRFGRAQSQCEWIEADGSRCPSIHWDRAPNGTRIVLTCAHVGVPKPDGSPGDKSDKMDCRPENLLALCQRHHLALDKDEHIANAAATRRRKQVEAGQLEMEGLEWEAGEGGRCDGD